MHIAMTSDARSFLEEHENWLHHDLASSVLVLNVAQSIRDIPDYCESPWLAAVRGGDRPLLIAVRTPPRSLLLSGGEAEALVELVPTVRMLFADLPGVIGPRAMVESFAEALAPGAWHEHMAMRLYRLDAVSWPQDMAEGQLRALTPADLPLLTRWIEGFRFDIGLQDPTPAPTAAQRMHDLGRGWLFESQGQPVAAVAGAERVLGTAHVDFVYTPPELRGRGYATAATALLSQQLLDRGASACFLFTDLANPTSNGVYQRIGYRPVCDYADLAFDS